MPNAAKFVLPKVEKLIRAKELAQVIADIIITI